jgi:hypothetical protein
MALPRILTVENGKVVVDEVILGIPEFKQLYDYVDGDILPFQYIWSLLDPTSPFLNVLELEREEAVLKDFPVHNLLGDLKMIAAIEKAELLYFSPIRNILKGAKKAVENVSLYLQTTDVLDGRDGNLTQIVNTVKTLPQLIKAYQEAENSYLQEVQKNRGDSQKAVDEDVDDNYND